MTDGLSRTERKRRWTTAFGWVAGGALGLLLNYVIYLAVGESYPTVPTTFTLFLVGTFSGMAIADKLGERGFAPLGITAGILSALFVMLMVAVAITSR